MVLSQQANSLLSTKYLKMSPILTRENLQNNEGLPGLAGGASSDDKVSEDL
jgi:hypothetical protein